MARSCKLPSKKVDGESLEGNEISLVQLKTKTYPRLKLAPSAGSRQEFNEIVCQAESQYIV